MATRTSTRTTKAVKFIDTVGSDDDEQGDDGGEEGDLEKPSSIQVKADSKKSRGRPPNSRRNRSKNDDDDEEWNASNERIDGNDDDDDVEDDDEIGEDETKKYPANRTTNSVYDFG